MQNPGKMCYWTKFHDKIWYQLKNCARIWYGVKSYDKFCYQAEVLEKSIKKDTIKVAVTYIWLLLCAKLHHLFLS